MADRQQQVQKPFSWQKNVFFFVFQRKIYKINEINLQNFSKNKLPRNRCWYLWLVCKCNERYFKNYF